MLKFSPANILVAHMLKHSSQKTLKPGLSFTLITSVVMCKVCVHKECLISKMCFKSFLHNFPWKALCGFSVRIFKVTFIEEFFGTWGVVWESPQESCSLRYLIPWSTLEKEDANCASCSFTPPFLWLKCHVMPYSLTLRHNY